MSKGIGRKVYRSSSYNKKKRVKKAVGVFVGIICIAALVFVGYSAGKPIYDYLNSNDISTEDTQEPWKPSISTEPADEEDDSTAGEKEEEDNRENLQEDEEQVPVNSNDFTACRIPEAALASANELNDYISQVKNGGYNAVIVTLKSEGGKINYNTSSEFAKTGADAVQGTMPAVQIASMIKGGGLKAFAVINILEDNNRYGENRDGSYHNSDGTTWLDNAPSKGGKPWLSPFETDTVTYTEYLFDEVSEAGFDGVIAEGLAFPHFRNSDIKYIGDIVNSPDRYKSLISLANTAKAAAEANSAKFMLDLSAADILKGEAEIFKPDELGEITVMLSYDPAELNETIVYNNREIVLSDMSAAEKFKAVMEIVKAEAGDSITIIPCMNYGQFNQTDYNDTIDELIKEQYTSYAVK